MTAIRPLVCFALAAIPSLALAESCPQPLDDALRLIFVTAPSVNSHNAKLRLFSRSTPNDRWQSRGAVEPVTLGKAGLGWGFPFLAFKKGSEPEKIEGDKRTPAGIFRIGPSFGFSELNMPGFIHIQPGETVCVEDPYSPHYNTITTRTVIGRDIEIEEMARTPLYRRGVFVNYPTDRANRRGSCIFIHIWPGPGQGTAGCIALPERRVRSLQEFTAPGAVIAVLPEPAIERFGGCLPAGTAKRAAAN
jgi:L,D-peptidoglycan transpeptidase YkuD (ErfK/YbiS/YcfS/YnhG family)